MVISVDRLEDAEIVDITVSVEVQVGYGIGGVVEKGLELLDRVGLGEEGRERLQVKLKRKVFSL